MSLSRYYFHTMRSQNLPKIILAITLSAIYLTSMARGLTWANQGADGGDLITAAATGGIAHPSGYPTYLLLARLFQLIPIKSLAFRTNLLSVVTAVCAALVVYELSSAQKNRLASIASAYAIGLSPLFWSQAVITEVYTLHILFIAIFLHLSTKDKNHFLVGVTIGLAAGNHITSLLLLPLLFRKEKKISLQHFLGMFLGLLVYATIPLRAALHPPVNWGNPTTLENFIWLVSGKLYQNQFFNLSTAALWERARATAALFLEQFGITGLLIGFGGLIICYKPTQTNHNMLWIATAYLFFPLTYNTRDSFLYLLPVFLCFAIWIGIGLNALMESAAQRSHHLSLGIGLIFISILFIRAGMHWTQVDASHDQRAEKFGTEAMTNLPKNAIVFAEGDQAVLTLWYFHYALRQRPDLAIIASDLLQNEWYQESVRNNYPNLKLPDGFFMFAETIIAHNPERSACKIGVDLVAQCKHK